MRAKVGLLKPATRVVSDECILPYPCQFPVVILHRNISTKVKGNGKLGRTLCPSLAMLYLLENMGYFVWQVVDT